MGYKLIAQIVLIVASLVIIFAFIKPSFEGIKQTQDQLFQYQATLDKATEFNALLRELISTRDSIPSESKDALERFVPSEIDTLQIMKDIETIFMLNNVPILSLTATEEIEPTTDINFEGEVVVKEGVANTSYQDFEVAFAGTYEQMKNILLYVEANASLLEVAELTFDTTTEADSTEDEKQTEKGNHNFEMKLRTYGVVTSNN